MEARAHTRETYTSPGQESRIDQDLAECTKDFLSNTRELLKTSQGRHVGIIGAGFAGLRCAEVLIAGGAQVTILEARDRLGGRVHQTNFHGRMVDMGPNWIHGTSTNLILKLAKKTATALSLVEDSPCIFDSSGQLLDKEKATELLDVLWDIISDAFKYSNEKCKRILPTESLKDFIITQARGRGLSPQDQTLLFQTAEMWGGFIGDPLEKQSLRHFWLEECLDGENIFVANTHANILNALAESAQKYAEIVTETRVTGIENINTIDSDGFLSRVLVKASNNRTFEFDSVVVTVPLGLLKRQSPTFSPPLTPQIRRAIDRAHYSSLEKVLITFPSAFWEENTPNQETKAGSTTFAHFPPPQIHRPKPRKLHAQPTLLFSIYGPCAAYVTSQTAKLSRESLEYFAVINDFFQPYYSLLPNYNPDNPSCHPSTVLTTDWQNDELAGYGSYMNFQTSSQPTERLEETISLEDDLRALRHGMPERNIWIAGEHAAPFVALGTLSGAYWSGESVAVRILCRERKVSAVREGWIGKWQGEVAPARSWDMARNLEMSECFPGMVSSLVG